MNQTEMLQKQPILKLMVHLSVPAILSMLVSSLNLMIDRMFVSWGVGTVGISAVTVSTGITLILQGFSLLLSAGGASLVALKLGKKDKAGAEKLMGNLFALSVLFSLVLTVVGLLVLKPLLFLYGANEGNIGAAMQFSTVLVGGTLLFILAQSNNNLIKGMGYAKRAFINFGISILVNTLLDPVFIFLFGWGVTGAGLSTVIGYVFSAGLSIQFLRSSKSAANLKLRNIRFESTVVAMILRIGLPACITQLALSLVSLIFNRVAVPIGGNTAVAAYGMIYGAIMLINMPIMGLGQGIQPIFGYNYSVGNMKRVKETLQKSLLYSTVFCVAVSLVVMLFNRPIAVAFSGRSSGVLTEMIAQGLRLSFLSVPFVGFILLGANYFQYIGKYQRSTILSALRQLVFLIPFVMVLPKFWGMTGLWLATPLADVLTVGVTFWLIRREIKGLSSSAQISIV